MQQTVALAETALPWDVPVGCQVWTPTDNGHWLLVSQAVNQRERDQDPTAHAELLALRRAGQVLGHWRLPHAVLVVTLEPCAMCASAIRQARVGAVYFGAYDALAGAVGSQWNLLAQEAGHTQPPVPAYGGILEDVCQAQLHTFFRQKRHAPAALKQDLARGYD
jgi:tRNA(adenine34) deaminase